MKFQEGKVIEKFKVKKNSKEINVTLRFPKRNDSDDLMNYINSLVAEGAFVYTQKKFTIEQETKYLAESMKNMAHNREIAVVVEVAGKAIAMSEIKKSEADSNSHVSVIRIGLPKKYRGLGIAKKLMDLLIIMGRIELKSEIIMLSVYSGNIRAQKFFERLGFKKIGIIPRGAKLRGKYYDDIIMVLKL